MDRRRRFGVSTLGGAWGLDEVAEIASAVGRRPEMVLWFEDFAAGPPVREIGRVTATGAMPVVTWEPWVWRTDRQRDADALMPQIAAGEYDAHLTAWADALAGTQSPVVIRLAHEVQRGLVPVVADRRHLIGGLRRRVASCPRPVPRPRGRSRAVDVGARRSQLH